ncbi:MAG: phage tail sheath subtilisin-like domain-containing protein, partial [Gemmatimonadota bacterium]|nr:phage tail sheath subtilisin-like domain-containing protein [Gemmatimonadota bacterium]
PRGPARVPLFGASWAPGTCEEGATGTRSVPVPVESWDEYVRTFGAFEGPGLLPYAVASFFENGGARAYIVRIVHEYLLPDGTHDEASNALGIATARVKGLLASASGGDTEIWLRARDEGAWGNALRATLSFRTRPLAIPTTAFTATGFVFERGVDIVAGAVMRLDYGFGALTIARVARVWEEWHPERAVIERHASFEAPVPLAVLRTELVEGVLDVDDGDGRAERHEGLGLASSHPRWLARVLVEESRLLYPGENIELPAGDPRRAWDDGRDLVIDPLLPDHKTDSFASPALDPVTLKYLPAGNRYRDLVPEDFFDDRWVVGDECPGDGVHSLVQISDLSLVVAPDLYSPRPIAPVEPVIDEGGAGSEFCECIEPVIETQTPPPEDLDGLLLDPATDLAAIIELQRRLIELATSLESFVVLLDVPPGLSQRRMLYWRERLHAMYSAAYHPWLLVSRADDKRDVPIAVNPAAVAAGIIARREITRGVQYGPANEIAIGVFDVADHVSPARHDELHQNAINVYIRERDGARLTAARTLSPDPSYRQLSVRRLMTMLRRVLYRQMQWAVFEPNDSRLRGDIRNQLDAFLRQLFKADAFAGARAEDAFFVRCDDELNPQSVVDQGRLYAYVGVAPAEPLEFLVLQIARDGDGTLRVQG